MTAAVRTPASGAAKRILYIEDHKDSSEMLAIMLGNAGYEVATANTVANGLSLAGFERFDLYILDSRFSDGTGVDLCRQIRAFDPDTPIIFYSSGAYRSDIEAGMAAGAQRYLTKPGGIEIIEQTIAGLLTCTAKARALSAEDNNDSGPGTEVISLIEFNDRAKKQQIANQGGGGLLRKTHRHPHDHR